MNNTAATIQSKPIVQLPASTGRAINLWWVGVFCISFASMTIWVAGCSDSRPFQGNSQRRGLDGATTQDINGGTTVQIVEAGSEALRNYFDSVRARPNAGIIDAGPALYTQRGGTERLGDQTLRPNNQFRRTGKIWVTESEGRLVAHCQIQRQRLDTSEYVALRTHDEFTDLPTATPIDADAGLTADQKQVWTDLPRDTGLEREVLQILMRRLGDPNTLDTGN